MVSVLTCLTKCAMADGNNNNSKVILLVDLIVVQIVIAQ